MNNKKCNYCEKGLIDFTSFGSNNKAEVFIQELNILTFYGDDGASYYLQCNYCPFCGRKLTLLTTKCKKLSIGRLAY